MRVNVGAATRRLPEHSGLTFTHTSGNGYLDGDPYKAAEVIAKTRITEWNALLGTWVN